MYGCYHQWGNWGDPYAISFASLFGPQKPKPDCGATVSKSHDGHYVFRVVDGVENYLHKDGTWHKQCGLPNFYASEREATVAAVLAGMVSPEVKELKAANETAQKRLAAKQAVVDQLNKTWENLREENRKLKCELHDASAAASFATQERDSLTAEVAKLKGDLAQGLIRIGLLTAIKSAAEGTPVGYYDKSEALDSVRKLRADYEAFQKAYISDFDRLNKLAGDCPAGACLADWAADEIERLRASRENLSRCLNATSFKVAKAREALA